MGFVGFLRFCLFCFDFLAWPAFALAYPLWASIRAIETGSKYHMRKLVTYWTLFSCLSLFEIFFATSIQWVPFWPYLKLVMICWLVIPRFDGACHVYQCLVHPCLSVNQQDVINWFCISKEKTSSEEMFLASAEKYIKENGAEALEKLLANKDPSVVTFSQNTQANCKQHVLADATEVVKRVESPEKATTEEQLMECPKPHLVQSEKKEIVAPDAQQVTIPAESEEKRSLDIYALKKVQREWTCAMCQVTTTSEALLNSHLEGKKHKSELEKLKACTQTTKNVQSLPVKLANSNPEEMRTSSQTEKCSKPLAVKTNDTNQAKEKLKTSSPGEGSRQNTIEKPKTNHINVAASSQQMQEKVVNNNAGVVNHHRHHCCRICNVTCTSDMDMAAHLKGRRHLFEIENKPVINNAGVGNQHPKLRCGLCNVTCNSEMDMAAHLGGKKHALEIQTNPLNKLWCGICNVMCTSEMDMAAHLGGKRHALQILQC